MAQSAVRIVESQQNWSAGVDSSKVPMFATQRDPSGLLPNQLSWAQNVSVRGGGISPRSGWHRLGAIPTGQLNDSAMYRAIDDYPHLIASIAGTIYKIEVDGEEPVITNLSTLSGLSNPSTSKGFMAQGERFLVIQAGDYQTLPLFYDGVTLVRSRGMINSLLDDPTFTVPAVGQPVLVTLTSPYTGPNNALIEIQGYQYRQVVFDQRYSVSGNATANVSGFAPCITGNFQVTLPAGSVLYQPANPTANITIAAESTVDFTLVNNVLANASGTDVFFTSTTIPPATTYRIDNALSTNGCTVERINLQMTANALAAPGPNEVWLVNVNDPRAGEVVSVNTDESQLPAAGPMFYYMGRFWLGFGQEYLAGDIVGSRDSGTGAYNFKDSILAVTENDYISEGGTFSVPAEAGNITAIFANNALDTATGQGVLLVSTASGIFSVNVPPNRADWIALTEPIQRVAQLNFGVVSDRSVVVQNGDIFYRSQLGIQSFIEAIRFFGQPGNKPISSEVERALNIDDPTMLENVSGISFNNRLLMTCLPAVSDYGTVFRGIVAMDFEPTSGLQVNTIPAWDGILEGLDILKLLEGDFGGEKRAFAIVRSRLTNELELWEITKDAESDENTFGESRVTWAFETPSFAFRDPNQLKELDSMRLWVDKLYGRADFTVYYRNDQNACWQFWNAWTQCAQRTDCEAPLTEACSVPTVYKQQYRAMMAMPKPEAVCDPQSDRPTRQAYSFQLRIVIKGYCRVRGIFMYALERAEEPFYGLSCLGTDPCNTCPTGATGDQGATGARGTGIMTYFGSALDPNGVQTGQAGDVYKSLVSQGGDGSIWVKRTSGGTDNWI